MKIIRSILSVIFGIEGITKLLGLSFQKAFFTHWGHSFTFMYIIGALELLGAIGLWIPQLSLLANIGLIGLMIGAFYTHIESHDPVANMGLAIPASALLVTHLYLYFLYFRTRKSVY
jgi:putative oxidoreductase